MQTAFGHQKGDLNWNTAPNKHTSEKKLTAKIFTENKTPSLEMQSFVFGDIWAATKSMNLYGFKNPVIDIYTPTEMEWTWFEIKTVSE